MENNNTAPTAPKKSNLKFAIIFGVLVILGGSYGYSKYSHGLVHEETDDAQVETLISPVIPRVSGYINEIRVKDNQIVKKGDTLLILDDADFKIRVTQAEAAITYAQSSASVADAGLPVVAANVSSAASNIGTIDAQIEAAKVNAWRAQQDYVRYANLIEDHSITQQQYEQAYATKELADKQLNILKAQKESASRQTAAVSSQTNVTAKQINAATAIVKQKDAELAAAKLNLSYTVIIAATDGQISKVNLQPGQMIQAGQSLFNIIPISTKWVVANFKETQLTKMKVGQDVSLTIDAFPDHEFKGKVSSFSPATGSKFALLPPDNASGNFVKVVQRIPVKIEFSEPNDARLANIRPGMNVGVDVHLK